MSFDSYLWQAVENKQKFISQIITIKSPVRACEDVDETALPYAEIKALCSGSPLIKEKIDLDIEVARLRLLRADRQIQYYRLEDNLLRYYSENIEAAKSRIARTEKDMARYNANLPKVPSVPLETSADPETGEYAENALAAPPFPIMTVLGVYTFGNMIRINNALRVNIPERSESSKNQIESLYQQVEDAKRELKNPFAQE